MKSIIRILFLVVMASNAFAGAKLPGEYQMDIWTKMDNLSNSHETFYVSGKNMHRDIAFDDVPTSIAISNARHNVTYQLNVLKKIYEEVPYQPEVLDERIMWFDFEEKKDTQLKLIGSETINGQVCDVYRETSLKNPHDESTFWVSKVDGMVVRFIANEEVGNKKMVQTKIEWLIRPGPQSAELFNLPAGYNRKDVVVLASIEGGYLNSYELIARPKTVHRAICEGQGQYEIRYVERHMANPDCKDPSCFDDFDSDRFKFVGPALGGGMCLIGDDDYFRGKIILQFDDNEEGDHPQCDKGVIQALEKIKGIPIKGCWRLGRFGKAGSVNIAEFVERDSIRAAGLSLHDGKRIVLEDWTSKVPTEFAPDVWRLNDGGEFHPEEITVLFGLRSGDEFELVTKGMGGEGINYYLKRTVGDGFEEITSTYIYTMGH